MSKFLSGRQSNLKLGISGYTESKTVLQTTGKVGIGTTDAQNFSLFVVGPTNITDTLTVNNQNVTGVATFSGGVNYPDDVVVSWGDSQDLKVYHDGNGQSYIKDTGTGDLNLTSDGTGIHLQSSGGSTLARFYTAGPSEIHHVGSRKLHTTTGGVEVTGLTDTDSLNVSGQSTFNTVNVTGVSTFANNVEITGNLTVSGTRTFLNTTELEVQDINIGIASAIPKLSNAALDGAGITIYGNAGDKSLTWNNTNSRMEFNTDLYSPNFFVGGITASGLIDANGGINATTAKVEDLTDNRIVIAGVGGELEDDANLTFNGSEFNVGSAITAYAATGIVSATAFYGDGSNLQNTGATLSATSGVERLVTTQLTSGTMVDAATDADLTFNATDNLLHTPKIDVAGLSPDGTTFGASGYVPIADGSGGWNWQSVQGASSVNTILNGFTVSEEGVVVGTAGSITQLDFRGVNVLASADTAPNGIATVTIALNQSLDSIDVSGIATFRGLVGNGVTFGSQGQYLEATGIGITWKNFPTLRTTQTNTATAGQTAFNFSYNIDFLDVFVNGVKLSSSEYTATNGNQIVLDTPAFAGETVEFHSYNVASTYGGGGGGGGGASNLNGLTDVTIGTLADNQLLQYNSSSGEWENISAATVVGAASSFATKSATATTATNNQTTFNGTYTIGFVDVFLNGVKQSEDEYTATSGTNIVLSTGASEGDLIEVVGLTANVPGSGGGGGSYANSDVDTHLNTSTASTGEVLSWNGSDYDWVAQSGGGGGGGISLTDLSVTTNSVGTAALAYNNSNGVFSYTPPDLSSFATTTALNTAVSNSSNWDTAYGWGNHASAGYLTAETDTLASVTGRGSSTNVDLTFSGNLSASGISTLSNVTVGGASTEMVVDGDLRVTGIITTGTGSVTIDGTTNEIIVGTGVTIYGNTGIISATKIASHSLQFTDNNVTIAGTSGTAGQFKQIGGAPFYYDGTAWREIVLSDGTPVTTSADTDWDNVLIRLDFEQASTDISLIENKKVVGDGTAQNPSSSVSTNVDLTGSPVKFGSKALRFDGSAGGTMPFAWENRDSVPNQLFTFEGPFTIELWIYLSELPGTGECFPILSQTEIAASPDDDWSLNITRSGTGSDYNINWYNQNHSDGNVNSGYGDRIGLLGGTSLLNQWNHIALVREAGDSSIHLYWNGTESGYTNGSVDSLIDTTVNDAAPSDYISFGYHYNLNSTQRWFTGVMDDVRISKSARYTSNFTAPTAAHPISGTSTTVYTPPGSKQGEIALGSTPVWTGTTGVTVSQVASGQYRMTFSSAFASDTAYTVNANAMDYDPATSIVGVGVSRVSSSACDFFVSRMSDSTLVDTGSLSISVYKK